MLIVLGFYTHPVKQQHILPFYFLDVTNHEVIL
jgi:hypothetical protein